MRHAIANYLESRNSIRSRVVLASGVALSALVLGQSCAVQAQTIPAGNTSPIAFSNTGTNQPNQQTVGLPGASGGNSQSYTISSQTPQTVKSDSATSIVRIQTTGGSGGNGGYSNQDDEHDGPLGGNGGTGGMADFDSAPEPVFDSTTGPFSAPSHKATRSPVSHQRGARR